MSLSIRYIESLLFYDIPQVFVGEDQAGCLYMCYPLSDEADGWRYFCTPVSRKNIDDFRFGKTSLRDIFLESRTKDYYTCNIMDFSQNFIPMELYTKDITEDILPGKDCVLNDFDTSSNELVTEAKKEKNCLNKVSDINT
ncbi:hypothetical protein MBAV_002899 [Candidatus Magnetobacterium bavaricum]|uniref:DUF6575 domain-containing protein n=1 Tax=Candidatus Magnetobacterium bavaricum TaxID=29290 RepID=A0A0F3GW76_9BACT|nr:hypothetical protein MBAV_002899 [Candidatus Magnetobacterium bavaricum]